MDIYKIGFDLNRVRISKLCKSIRQHCKDSRHLRWQMNGLDLPDPHFTKGGLFCSKSECLADAEVEGLRAFAGIAVNLAEYITIIEAQGNVFDFNPQS